MKKLFNGIAPVTFYIGVIGCLLFVGCSKDDTSGKEEPVAVDKTPPKITLADLPEKVESATELNIAVSDESENVTTKIYVDDAEVFSTDKKTFNFTLDPFDYKTGNRNLSIISTDKSGNEATSRSAFESKKLLLVYPDPLRNIELETRDSYIAVNKMDGELVSFKKIESDEVIKLYADDDFERQDIVITQYNIGLDNLNLIYVYSYGGIAPGTVIISKAEQEIQVIDWANRKLGFPFLKLGLLISSPGPLLANNHGSSILPNYNGSGDSYVLSYASELDLNCFTYCFPKDGILETDYKYLLIKDVDKMEYGLDDFSSITKTSDIDIPNGNAYSLVLNGYKDEATYGKFRYHKLFEKKGLIAENLSIQVPLIDGFEVYQTEFSLKLGNNKSIGISQKGLGPIVIPDLDIIKNGNDLEFKGDYDYSWMKFYKTLQESNGSILNMFEWDYFSKPTATAKIPFYIFELPDPVKEKVREKSIELTPEGLAPNYLLCRLTDYEGDIVLENMAFGAHYPPNRLGDNVSITLEITN